MNVVFKKGDELVQSAEMLSTTPANVLAPGEAVTFVSGDEMDADDQDGEMLARELATFTGTYSKEEAKRILSEVLAKGEGENVRSILPSEALRHLAEWI